MELIVNGAFKDPKQELEIFNYDKGFDIFVTYKLSSFRAQHGIYEDIFHNCTEFHHLFDTDHSAFESDIHMTGRTRNVNDIVRITVTDATVLHETETYECNIETLHQHDSESCIFLGTVDNQDLYFSEKGGFGATVIARYGSDGADYFSGLCFSKEGILRVAAERAIERGLLTREEWRSQVYRMYFPYSHVKSLMLMSDDELWNMAMEKRYSFNSSSDIELIFNILERRKQDSNN